VGAGRRKSSVKPSPATLPPPLLGVRRLDAAFEEISRILRRISPAGD
jgi:hypothetical protein